MTAASISVVAGGGEDGAAAGVEAGVVLEGGDGGDDGVEGGARLRRGCAGRLAARRAGRRGWRRVVGGQAVRRSVPAPPWIRRVGSGMAGHGIADADRRLATSGS